LRLRHDPVAHPLVQRSRQRRAQQRSRITLSQTLDDQLREPRQLPLLAGTRREDQRDRLRQQAPRHERERLSRCPIEPLRIIHQANQGPLLRHLRQQAEDCQTDEKTVRDVPATQPERRAKCLALRGGQNVEPVEHRRAQLMHPRERQLHLGLDPRRTRDPTSGRPLSQVRQQRRLADAGLPANHQRPASPLAHAVKQPLQRVALSLTPEQHLPTPPRAQLFVTQHPGGV
jgi:hypothetical protein